MKHFRAHLGNVQDVALNHNGTLLATVSNDKMAKIFDVVNFDMINIIKLGETKFAYIWEYFQISICSSRIGQMVE